ncbi:arsenic resistance protein ArsB [Candidatus Acidianus copahuensis]|uniref:Arsenic resistance protein ArsB n=1 Tax=Candidatus Acidianus copahuensis TaxID=1160895 RepID=A0A031LIX9_9CREN|nr:SLC13 family permease [Candidatus Acidianus copahuensis]EZQ02102.1 arsenic resistance protein ArsB [Candidatus Acidianus copahuensis]
MNYLAIFVAILTFSLIASREITKIPPWASMFFGGVLMMVLGVITPSEAFASINLDVIIFLITLFTFASALEVSGFLKYLAYKIISKLKTGPNVLFGVLAFSGILSNLVTNDGVSATWSSVVLEASKAMKIDEKPLMYALAFGVTIGSVMLPTGNPQDLLIALDAGIKSPFIVFLKFLFLPTIINLVITYPILLFMFKKKISAKVDDIAEVKLEDKTLAYLSFSLLLITVFLFFSLSLIRVDIVLGSLITSSVLLLISSRRREILRRVDWSTVLFFFGLFMFTQGLLSGGIISFLSSILPPPTSVILIMISSVLLSQVISNVPLVAIFITVMMPYHPTIVEWMALAAGSTIAGNFTLIGAASNVIISEAVETRGGKGFGFFEFMKYSIPVLLLNFVILFLFLRLESP